MLRKTVVILTMLLCSMSTQLSALELGAVTVESVLNQPLRMHVELLQLGDVQLLATRPRALLKSYPRHALAEWSIA